MALSLHAEYLLGYLAGAKNLAARDVVPFARLDPGDTTAQGRALVKALALGVSDGRKGHALRDASEVRMRVLALLAQKDPPVSSPSVVPPSNDAEVASALAGRESYPQPIDDILRQAAEGG